MSNNTETFIIELKDKNVSKGLDQVSNKADKAKGKVNALSGAFRIFGGILAGISIAKIGGEVIDTLAKFERFEAVLTNTLGSGSAAQTALAELTEFAAKTPFEVDSLTDSFVRLANQGFRPTMEEMTKLGDLASSKGKGISQLAEALIDAEVGEMERLKEFGVRAKKEGDKVSFSFKGVTTTVQNSETAIRAYILSLGDAAGVSGAMAAISATTGGKISNLKDTVTQLYLTLGKKLKPQIDGLISGLSDTVKWLGDAITWLNSGSTSAEVFIAIIGGLTGAIVLYNVVMGAAAVWTGIVTAATWLWNVALLANPIGLIIIAVTALVAGITYLSRNFTGFGTVWTHTWAGIKGIAMAYISAVQTVWGSLIDGFMIGLNTIKKGWYEFKNAVGLGDKAENLTIIEQINADTERRKREIVDGAKETLRLTQEAALEFSRAGTAALLIRKKTPEELAKEEKDKFVNEGGKGSASVPGLTTGAGNKNLGAGLSEVRASAPKTFNINIGSLIKENNINTTNLTEGSLKIKELLTKALLTAVNDSQIVAE